MNIRSWFLLLGLVLVTLATAEIGLRPHSGAAQGDDVQLIAPADKATCLGCHAEHIDQKLLDASAHGRLNCQNCHVGIDRFPHPEAGLARKPACVTCHGSQVSALNGSIHAAQGGKRALPSCNTCHGANAHVVPRISKSDLQKKEASCRSCHSDMAAALSASVHGGAHAGRTTVSARPTCLSCHGSDPHGIKAPGTTPAQRADATCRRCHTDNAAMVASSAHGQLDKTGKPFSCLTCHTGGPHAITRPVAAASPQVEETCRRCHTDIVDKLSSSVHGVVGKPGHAAINCLTCHSGSPHSIGKTRTLTNTEKSALCERCHLPVARQLANSAHGPSDIAADKRPSCISCHGGDSHGVGAPVKMTSSQKSATCKNCHTDIAKRFAASIHGLNPTGKAPDCVDCHGGKAHTIAMPTTQTREQQEAKCIACHRSLSAELAKSVHNRPDIVAGDHPSCLSCHGGSPHDIVPPAHRTPQQLAALCGTCHSDEARMSRYGLTTGAFSSYEQSFHGRALMKFGKTKVANCTDCHGLHGVLSPKDTDSPTHPDHVAATCGKCHPGGNMNFAMSGANHLRLRIDSTPLLRIEEQLFRGLIFGTLGFLLGMVLLDMNRKVFRHDADPASGRPAAVLIAVSFTILVAGVVLAYFRMRGAGWLWLLAIGLMVLASVIVSIRKKKNGGEAHEKHYRRLSRIQRTQHILLASSFTVLVLTGFPIHFANVEWTHYMLNIFGGFDSARIVHRVAGVVMVLNWFWHLGYLMYAWKRAGFSLKSWTMFPTWKDVIDFVHTIKYGLGLRDQPPQFDRFQFKEKFDYFADIWGTIVMGSTGFILWFPTVLGNQLPDVAFGFSYIAHSYEGLLAMLAIILWHFYNAHFNPDIFPMSATWYSGSMSESEMAREHPLEKARLDAEMATQIGKPAIK